MSAIVPFVDNGKVPAAIKSIFGDAPNDLVGNSAGGGFPVISIKGKVFHITRGDEKVLVTKPGEDDPASSLEVVVIRANPNRSKVYYSEGYTEGSQAKPTCYSNNGIAPEQDAQVPQSKQCATCVHNQWGAKVSEAGKKMKACADSRRLAISTVDTPADPMLLRVPAASMKSLEEYGKMLAARGLPPQAVVTKISFDYTVAHPALTFKPVGLITDATLLGEIKKQGDTELVSQIIGTKFVAPAGQAEAAADDAQELTFKAVSTAPEVPAKAAAPAPAPEKPKAPAKPAPAKEVKAGGLESSISAMLDGLDLDD